jgi:flavin-dependent dehydrogenase
MPGPCLSLDEACGQTWPVVIVGAGPAGTLAAYLLARRGVPVLLVDKASFPRPKVCGACLNRRVLSILGRAGLGGLPRRLGAKTLSRLVLSVRRRQATIKLAQSAAISRQAFDDALVSEARQAGATFLPHTMARLDPALGPYRLINLDQRGLRRQVRARLVLAADGISGSLMSALHGWHPRVPTDSWIGAGTVCGSVSATCNAGTIWMTFGRSGYMGSVILEDGTLNVAAAFDPGAVRAAGGPGPLAQSLLEEAGMPPVYGLAKSAWRGTPMLSRRPPWVASHRVLVLGDAAGYIEPFTGEGIAWAMAAAEAVVPIALEAADRWHPVHGVRWHHEFHQKIVSRQSVCRLLTRAIRYPTITSLMVEILARAPLMGQWFQSQMNRGC